MTETAVSDQEMRDRAIDPGRSFIVQAPAGSGKTELLAQRYLQLLGHAQAPEEIVAITFTRKAAAEMRTRILGALERGASDAPPEREHENKTWQLARAALRQDRLQQWDLLQNPGRLNIQTIDALCALITRRMPILAEFGFDPAISENPGLLYREAARETLALLESGTDWADDVARLLVYLDNNFQKLEALLESMLKKRDQWLRVIGGAGEPDDRMRENLEASLKRTITAHLKKTRDALPAEDISELIELACYAAGNLERAGSEDPITLCRDINDLPGAEVEDLAPWNGIARLLLTGKGEWRRALTRNEGFPSKSDASGNVALKRDEMKKRIATLIGRMNDREQFRQLLVDVTCLPAPRYSDDQWEVLRSLIKVLRLSVAQLNITFREHGEVDYIEKALAAQRALGEIDAPTDLAFAFDARIRHLLIDEFQDTSFTQFELLKRLTAGWQPGDGRTLFVVGDPMQSIYRFREGEVGLFLAARRNGVEALSLDPVELSVNFRSEHGIVDWVNQTFEDVLPKSEDPRTGAVTYSPSVSFHGAGNGEAVVVYPFARNDHEEEASRVVEIVAGERAAGRSVAILVRARTHLAAVVPALRRAGVRFQSVNIDPLATRPAIQDLMALTRALLHTGDRVAWLSVLRAPWCGLTLADFHTLIHGTLEAPPPDRHPSTPVPQLLEKAERVGSLSDDGRARIERIWPVLRKRIESRGRFGLRALVQGAWLALGGASCYVNPAAVSDEAGAFFDLLDELDGGGDIPDPLVIEEAAADLFAPADPTGDPDVQVMTIHGAKGLEFDTVILPGLGRRSRSSDSPLLAWMELPRGIDTQPDLLLAPIPAPAQKDRTFDFIKKMETQKDDHETRRILYVAATRARQRLYLMGCAESQDDAGAWKAASGSFLNILWNSVCTYYDDSLPSPTDGDADAESRTARAEPQFIRRLPLGWNRAPFPPSVAWKARAARAATEAGEERVFDFWMDDTGRHTGTVVHRLLVQIAEQGAESWSEEKLNRLTPVILSALRRSGVSGAALDTAGEDVRSALSRALADDRGRWILNGDHASAKNEFAVSGVLEGALYNVTIDRTFVDDTGTRWIIDYKTGAPGKAESEEAYLDRQQEYYRKQLDLYAALFRGLDDRPIRLGLYFPMTGGWREWVAA